MELQSVLLPYYREQMTFQRLLRRRVSVEDDHVDVKERTHARSRKPLFHRNKIESSGTSAKHILFGIASRFGCGTLVQEEAMLRAVVVYSRNFRRRGKGLKRTW